jgi:hypothetical protein
MSVRHKPAAPMRPAGPSPRLAQVLKAGQEQREKREEAVAKQGVAAGAAGSALPAIQGRPEGAGVWGELSQAGPARPVQPA